ncbi:MAG: histidine phosphatase family protein [Clostridia bacterium]|nr:histidine phosphatase family protein [Clostridia bacterium]
MRIIFVRHGEPDYARDCLTDEGRLQAAAAAERLAGEGIGEIYASPCGRASETAAFTAARLGMQVTTLDYLREITWGGPGIPCDGHPWTLGDRMLAEGFDFRTRDWRTHPYFDGNAATVCCAQIEARFDAFLSERGYRHEGRRFFCEGATDGTVAVFSHGGSGACMLAHLLGLPFPYVASVMPYDFTSIIILDLPVNEGSYVFPRIELFNDCAHIRRSAGGPTLQQTSE